MPQVVAIVPVESRVFGKPFKVDSAQAVFPRVHEKSAFQVALRPLPPISLSVVRLLSIPGESKEEAVHADQVSYETGGRRDTADIWILDHLRSSLQETWPGHPVAVRSLLLL